MTTPKPMADVKRCALCERHPPFGTACCLLCRFALPKYVTVYLTHKPADGVNMLDKLRPMVHAYQDAARNN